MAFVGIVIFCHKPTVVFDVLKCLAREPTETNQLFELSSLGSGQILLPMAEGTCKNGNLAKKNKKKNMVMLLTPCIHGY